MIDPEHPVLLRPWQYEVVAIEISFGSPSPALEIAFARDGVLRQVRFPNPRDIRFAEGARGESGGLQMSDLRIYDVSGRGLEGLRVHVVNDGSSPGTLEFWASDAIDVTE